MSMIATSAPSVRPLRLWPGVVFVTLQWVFWLGVPLVLPEQGAIGIIGGVAGAALVLLWWLFFSRAPWLDRVLALVAAVVGIIAARALVDVSVTTGLMGRGHYVLSIPHVCLGIVLGAAISRGMSTGLRRAVLIATVVLGALSVALVRLDGVSGAGGFNLAWRWTETREERFLAQTRNEPLPPPSAEKPAVPTVEKPAEAKPAEVTAAPPVAPSAPTLEGEWTGFRGARRDNVVRGVKIATDWSRTPPTEIWRRPVGPGWSSFAVAGDLIYTQEQRGEQEVVAAYRLATGQPVWRHSYDARFYESNAGTGPRATPAVHNGRVFTQGAKGTVNALDARTGAVVWTRDGAADTGAPMPGWGFTGSPLAVDDMVIVATSGRLVAYDAATGAPRWKQSTSSAGYSSPHLVTIDGVPQVVLLSGGGGATSMLPADGTILWQSTWQEGVSIVQPALVSDNSIITTTGDAMGGQGMRRIAVTKGGDGWKVEERWTSRGLKPYFSDFVVHKGHAFGFDGTILSSINLETGERAWKGGRYGAGQMLLLAGQDLLLVLSEDGELALVSALPDKHTELARFKAIEGKTWNHPVIVGDVVLVRNGEEMAAFRLPR